MLVITPTHTQILQILLQNKNINANLKSNSGWSSFLSACWNNRYESVLLMIQDARVDVNMADNYGWSPLMWACLIGYTQIVQLLLSSGRNIERHEKSTKDYLNKKNKNNM